MSKISALIDALERAGYIVHDIGDYISIQRFTTAGQDFSTELYKDKSFFKQAQDNFENYDPSCETYLWLDETGHGKNGAPYELIDVYNDMLECKAMLCEILYIVRRFEH